MFRRNLKRYTTIFILLFSFVSIITAEELVLWHTSFVNEWGGREKLVNYFEENTSLNVSDDYGLALYRDVAQKLIIQGKTGKPDVVEGVLEQLITFAKADLIMPLNNFWENYEDKEEYLSNVIDAVTIDGQIYGIPFNTNVRLLLYRKSVFEKYNLEVPKTWDELIETGAFISKNVDGMKGFILTSKKREVRAFQEFMSFYFQLNKHMFEVKGDKVKVVATPEQLTQVLTLYKDLFESGAISKDDRGADWKEIDYGYTSGDVAMITVGPWIWGHRYEDEKRAQIIDDTGIAALPIPKNGAPGTYLEVKAIMMNKYTKDPQKAWELVKEVTSKDFQLLLDSESGVLSPRKDVMAEEKMRENWWLKGFGEYLDTGVALDPVSWERPQNAIINAIQQVIYNEGTPEEIGQALYEELQNIAEEL